MRLCVSTDAACTDVGQNSTFCLMPTVYFSQKTVTIIWKIKLSCLHL